MATHSAILAWKITWTETPGRLQSTGSQRVAHDWATEQGHTYIIYTLYTFSRYLFIQNPLIFSCLLSFQKVEIPLPGFITDKTNSCWNKVLGTMKMLSAFWNSLCSTVHRWVKVLWQEQMFYSQMYMSKNIELRLIFNSFVQKKYGYWKWIFCIGGEQNWEGFGTFFPPLISIFIYVFRLH